MDRVVNVELIQFTSKHGKTYGRLVLLEIPSPPLPLVLIIVVLANKVHLN